MDEGKAIYSNFIDKKVGITLRNEALICGICRSLDGYLNIVLEGAVYRHVADTEESFSSCFVRGMSVMHIEVMK
ncbi:U6 snRNA-associated Sm-like protein LSm2 [Enteropsectra breve]|nr:U6 snRNA-associated Sm-like protein LSm2 [Enteropsectra breve]